jgi:protein-S-isoprenylcysteine O-methyltransferase Ste14
MTVTIIRTVRAFAWIGAVVFVGALAYFLFSYWFRFAVVAAGPAQPGSIVANVVLFSIFALHHSVFARERIRARVTAMVTRGVERSFYVWIASLLLIAVCALWRPIGGVAWHIEGPARWAMAALQVAGIGLTIRSAAIIDVLDLAGVRVAPPAPSGGGAPGAPEFKTNGPYGWVRHPIYAGWFLLVFGVGTMTMTRLVFAVVSSLYVLIAIPFEERSVRHSTGGPYDRYSRQVKWKLVPGLY